MHDKTYLQTYIVEFLFDFGDQSMSACYPPHSVNSVPASVMLLTFKNFLGCHGDGLVLGHIFVPSELLG